MSRSYRKVTIGDKTYEYFVGRSFVEIIISEDPKKKITPPIWNLKGISVDAFERGRWKKTSDGSVTPQEVVDFIKKVTE